MRYSCVQVSFADTYTDVCDALENNPPKLIQLLESHIILEDYIPTAFRRAYNSRFGRPHRYTLESFIRFFLLLKILGIATDTLLLNILRLSAELRRFCGFDKVPHPSLITRFRHNFQLHIHAMFNNLVEITEPICRELDAKKADYFIYDPTGVEVAVAENNPKFLNSKLQAAKKFASNNPAIDPHKLAYALLPDTAKANPFVKQQYINGHFCYAFKTGIVTNGLGIVRDIAFFDDTFRRRHPEAIAKKTDNPTLDKEIGDSVSLKPVLEDFFRAHPSFSYKTFLGDAAFDSYDNYSILRNQFHFERMCIPLNPRHSSNLPAAFDSNGTPLCPRDKTPFVFKGICRGANRSARFKWVCHKSQRIPGSARMICDCDNPCTTSSYGRCVYTYPDKNLRFYPGIPRATEHWDNLYAHRVLVERTIFSLKGPLCGAPRKSFSAATAKVDLLFAGIAQLVGVILAHAIAKPKLYKSIRKLIAA